MINSNIAMTTLKRVICVTCIKNKSIVFSFYNFYILYDIMKVDGASENHNINSLKVVIKYSKHIGQPSL